MFLKFITAFLASFITSSYCCAWIPLDELSIEEKVGQLLMVHFNGEEANDEAKILIQEAYIGSIIYYNWANALSSPQQIRMLSKQLQGLAQQNQSPIPLILAIDQEGGVVARLNQGFSSFPGNKALGVTEDPLLSELAAFAMGQELQAVGIHMNLAPVVDINSNAKNPVIEIRSFGSTAQEVIDFSKQALKGYHTAGIITTLKHFPGHGDVEVDSHADLPQVEKTIEQLYETELSPFIALAYHTDAIMTAHLLVKALDPFHCTTLSKDSLSLLRDNIGFQGVIISDSLVMEGLLKNCKSIDDAAIQAFTAGCDILMLGGKQLIGTHQEKEMTVKDVLRIHQALVRAIASDRALQQRLDQSVQRILDLKARYLRDHNLLNEKPLEQVVNTPKHIAIANEIARRSVQVKKAKPFELPTNGTLAVIAPLITKDLIEQTSLHRLCKTTTCLYFKELNPSDEEILKIERSTTPADLIIFCSYNAWKNDKQSLLIENLIQQDKPFILISLRDPLDASFFSGTHMTITTFSPTLPSIQAATDQIINLNLWQQ